ncbi:hypothetical protein HHX47_DHR1000361 [Lentinula edodes]|nr:hypothetical protein HHX47_DHR1000361 [Lentinula edodes]
MAFAQIIRLEPSFASFTCLRSTSEYPVIQLRTFLERLQCNDMPRSKVKYMQVVPNTSSVWGGVVLTEYLFEECSRCVDLILDSPYSHMC